MLEKLNFTKDDVLVEINRHSNFRFGTDVFDINDKAHFIPACDVVRAVCMPESITGCVLDTFMYHCSKFIKILDLQGCSSDLTTIPSGPHRNLTDSSLYLMSLKCVLLE